MYGTAHLLLRLYLVEFDVVQHWNRTWPPSLAFSYQQVNIHESRPPRSSPSPTEIVLVPSLYIEGHYDLESFVAE